MDRRFPRDVEWNPPASGKRAGPVMEGTLTSNLAEVMARLSTNSSRRRVFGGNQPGLIGSKVFSKMPFLPVRNSLRHFDLLLARNPQSPPRNPLTPSISTRTKVSTEALFRYSGSGMKRLPVTYPKTTRRTHPRKRPMIAPTIVRPICGLSRLSLHFGNSRPGNPLDHESAK